MSTLLAQIEDFLSCRRQSIVSWRYLLGRLASLFHLVPGGHLWMQFLQLVLKAQWDFHDETIVLSWTQEIKSDSMWWSDVRYLLAGVSLVHIQLDLLFWSNASDQGWGANLLDHFVSGRWSLEEQNLSINLRELRAIRLGLQNFVHALRDRTVGVFSDNTTTLAYIRKQGGTLSLALNKEAQILLHWAESLGNTIVPQFITGSRNVVADSLSHQDQVIGSEWTLAQDVVDELVRKWPATVNLFATSLNYCLPVYFSPRNDPPAAGTDAFFQSWNHLQAYAFPPFSLILNVINKLRSSNRKFLTLVVPLWPQKEWYPDLLSLSVSPPVVLPVRPDLLSLMFISSTNSFTCFIFTCGDCSAVCERIRHFPSGCPSASSLSSKLLSLSLLAPLGVLPALVY